MEIISNCTQEVIKKAAKALKDGHLVAFPTETVYGLGADATNEKAVSSIYSAKGRPTDHPLIVHISSLNKIGDWTIGVPDYAISLAREFWPGPMTLILKRSKLAKHFITGGQDSVGLRVPSHPLASELLSQFEQQGGLGIAAPSANKFGAVSPTSAEAVKHEIGEHLSVYDLILDGGQSQVGIESTIIDCTSAKGLILRPGAITFEMIQSITKLVVNIKNKKNETKFSGSFDSHYSPNTKVMLNTSTNPGDGFLALAEIMTPVGCVRLGAPKTIEEFARELYSSFRLGDTLQLPRIVVITPHSNGIGNAVNDRLLKASYKY
jgi:L-threonylcarbamoyladenylate synthase